MMNLQEQLERAKMAGVENWIDPNTQSKGWYTCLLTGKKMRGQQAQDQIARQEALVHEWTQEINAMKDSMDGEAEVQAEIEKPKVARPKRPVALTQMVEVIGGFHTEVLVTPTLDTHKSTKSKGVKTTIINCVDCGAQREIKVQDIFQVKRCPHCQAEHRKAMRRANYKAKKEAERQAKEVKEQEAKQNELQEIAERVGLTSDREERKPLLSAQQQVELLAQQGKLFED